MRYESESNPECSSLRTQPKQYARSHLNAQVVCQCRREEQRPSIPISLDSVMCFFVFLIPANRIVVSPNIVATISMLFYKPKVVFPFSNHVPVALATQPHQCPWERLHDVMLS